MSENNINILLDRVIAEKRLKNDAALSRLLEVAPPVVSKLRRFHLEVGPSIILKLHELGDIPLAEIRAEFPRKPISGAS